MPVMAYVAVLLAVVAYVVGSVAWPWLPVGGDPGLGVLFVAAALPSPRPPC